MKIKVNHVELAYEKTGSGAPLILLHGNGEDHHIFDAIVSKLQNHFTLYAIDSRNHGQSTASEDYSYQAMAGDIDGFIKALALEDVNLLGFSDGAIISLLLAINHAPYIRKMALLGVNLKPGDFTDESYAFVQQTYEETKDPLFELMLNHPNIELDDVKPVTVPTLVVAAEHDIFKPETFVSLTNAMPKAELLIMPGHEHDSYIVNNDMLYSDLVRFFS